MKAAVCRAFGSPLVIEEVNLAPPGPQDVHVAVRACSICHSDISYIDGIWGGELPAVYGHEVAGVVIATGAGVTACKPGDHVIATLVRHCGACRQCDHGMGVLCEGEFADTVEEPIASVSGDGLHKAMNCGGFAEECLVHQSQVETIDRELPFEIAALVACGVITGYGAVMRASSLRKSGHAVVTGCGGVGLNAIQAAALKGAASIVALDLEAGKRESALSFGATHAFDPRAADTAERILEITDGKGADVVFVTVGAKPAIDAAQGYLCKGGEVVVVGMPASDTRGDYDPGTLASWGKKLIGTKMGNTVISEDIPEILSHYRAGRYKLDELISGRYRLEEINHALDGVRSGKAVKNVILFD